MIANGKILLAVMAVVDATTIVMPAIRVAIFEILVDGVKAVTVLAAALVAGAMTTARALTSAAANAEASADLAAVLVGRFVCSLTLSFRFAPG